MKSCRAGIVALTGVWVDGELEGKARLVSHKTGAGGKALPVSHKTGAGGQGLPGLSGAGGIRSEGKGGNGS